MAASANASRNNWNAAICIPATFISLGMARWSTWCARPSCAQVCRPDTSASRPISTTTSHLRNRRSKRWPNISLVVSCEIPALPSWNRRGGASLDGRRGGSQIEISPDYAYHPPSLDVGSAAQSRWLPSIQPDPCQNRQRLKTCRLAAIRIIAAGSFFLHYN